MAVISGLGGKGFGQFFRMKGSMWRLRTSQSFIHALKGHELYSEGRSPGCDEPESSEPCKGETRESFGCVRSGLQGLGDFPTQGYRPSPWTCRTLTSNRSETQSRSLLRTRLARSRAKDSDSVGTVSTVVGSSCHLTTSELPEASASKSRKEA